MLYSFGDRQKAWQKLARIALPMLIASVLVVRFWFVVLPTLGIIFGAAVIAFLVEPLARVFEKKLRRNLSALFAIIAVFAIFLGVLLAFLPALIKELIELTQSLPAIFETLNGAFAAVGDWLQRYVPGLTLPTASIGDARIPDLAAGTILLAGNVADAMYKISLMFILSYFLLCDRTRILLRIEMLIPRAQRCTAVRMGNAVCRELKLYVRGQGMIALAVGILSAIGLTLVGVQASLVLGVIVGLLNMVPYFGPILGAIPAVLMGLGGGWTTAMLAAIVMFVVQQIDGMFISPRIMGNLAGVSPATVLIVVFAGSLLAGIVGMLFALPVLMAIRSIFRVFVQRNENI